MLYRSRSFIVASYVNMQDEKITSLLRRKSEYENYDCEDIVNDVDMDLFDLDRDTIKHLADLVEIKEKRISKQDALKYYIKYCNSTKKREDNRELGE